MHRGLWQLDQSVTALSPFSGAPRFRKRTHSRQTSVKRTKLLPGPVEARNKSNNNESWREQTDKALQQASSLWNSALDQFDSAVMPKERGDIRDQLLMALSIAVFVLFSMQLYRIYLHLYYAAGFRPLLRHR